MENMIENVQITMDEYLGLKNDIHENINRIAKSFVRIGQTLCRIEQTGAYRLEGYETLPEFARAEYDMKPSGVSRFVNVYKKFCESGQLKEKYEKYTYKQLVEMLNLPEEDQTLIGPKTSREDIRELKRFNREGMNDMHRLETWQDQESEEEEHRKLLTELLLSMFQQRSREEEFDRICSGILVGTMTEKEFAEIVNPSGSRTIRQGRTMAFLFDHEVRMKIWGENQPVVFTYGDLQTCFGETFKETLEEGENWWKHQFAREEHIEEAVPEEKSKLENPAPEPEKKTIAPAQKEPEKPKEETSVKPKEVKPTPGPMESKKETDPIKEAAPTSKIEEEEADQIRGQDSILNHPELLPDGYEAKAKVDGEPVAAEVEPTMAQRKKACLELVTIIQENLEIENYGAAIRSVDKLMVNLRVLGGE